MNKAKRVLALMIPLILLIACGFVLFIMRLFPVWRPAALHETTVKVKKRVGFFLSGSTQERRIMPPFGYRRTDADPDSFLAYMRGQELLPDGNPVYDYHGNSLGIGNAAAVYALPVGKDGTQQCADSIIRVWSDYLYERGEYDKLSYHLTNGMECSFDKWKRGWHVAAFGDFSWWMPVPVWGTSEENYRSWLMTVMRYAGTLSLEAESEPIDIADAQAGDFFCHGGSPGHAVLIVDEAVNAAGERQFLLAQGFMPAQSFHIIEDHGTSGDPWYTEEELSRETIELSSYTFHAGDLRRRAAWFE
ncbi:MAG TPA: hypothetical protein DDX71_00565 [Ruminococcus sp.]|nr:hypothetical protein [Ruminococcus sp.]